MPTLGRLYRPRPSRHNTLNQCWFNVGPPSTMLDQRKSTIESTSCVCWVYSTDHAHIGRSLRVNKHAWTAH